MRKYVFALMALTGCFEDSTSLMIKAQQAANAYEYAKRTGDTLLGCKVEGYVFWATECDLVTHEAVRSFYRIKCDTDCVRE